MEKQASPLDPEILALLEGLSIRVDHVVGGVLAGLHRSIRYGENIDFAEHKEYTIGDDPRHIDWKVLGRLDRYVVKKFEAEREIQATLGIDYSGSMDYRSGSFTKAEYANILAVSFAKLLLRQGDAVGLIVKSGKDSIYLPPRRSLEHLGAMIEVLERTGIQGSTNINEMVTRYLESAGERRMLVLFSDLFDPHPDMLDGLKIAAARGHEVSIFHVLDRDEIVFPFEDPTLFLSMEDDRQVVALPREVRRSYLEEMQKFLQFTRRFMLKAGIRYELSVTDEAPHKPLIRQLARRRAQGTASMERGR